MKIETSWISSTTGKQVNAYYEESDNFSNLPQEKIGSICAFCYFAGKFVMVKNEGRWEPVAGHVEKGESAEQALIREVKEESNMNVLQFFPIGFLYTYGQDIYQARYFCVVKPYGPFIKDPDGGVTEIKLVKPENLAKIIDWRGTDTVIRDRCMEIINKLGLDKK